ncbi:FecR family protein [Sungkyunkwania multivorans]|uniref:FecR family protein n=1 Tax=Sungkyunkwania multivorans TaxID=1173618 RepID=A0ABW3CSQ4_9FLAO
MDRAELIKKWLDNELSEAELQVFEKLEDHDALVKIAESAKGFKAPDYHVDSELERLLQAVSEKKKNRSGHWIKPLMRVAAALVLMVGGYFIFFNSTDTSIQTLAAEKTEFQLPDNSTVRLNALSTMTFNKKNWERNREVHLKGEAFFNVAKGATFDVETTSGTVSVLGTEFNVIDRDGFFEVICFEGLVRVVHEDKIAELSPNQRFVMIDGRIKEDIVALKGLPSWVNNESNFVSIPYYLVLKEFERQYDVTIISKGVSLNQHFTGSFTHQDQKLALASITLPMNLRYTVNGNTISIEGAVE